MISATANENRVAAVSCGTKERILLTRRHGATVGLDSLSVVAAAEHTVHHVPRSEEGRNLPVKFWRRCSARRGFGSSLARTEVDPNRSRVSKKPISQTFLRLNLFRQRSSDRTCRALCFSACNSMEGIGGASQGQLAPGAAPRRCNLKLSGYNVIKQAIARERRSYSSLTTCRCEKGEFVVPTTEKASPR